MLHTKRALITITSLFVFLFLAAGFAYAEGTGVINSQTVNMRSSADTSAKVVMQLSQDSKVTVVSKEGDWYKITCNDSTGWVFAKYVTLKDSVIDAGTIKGSDVNVRSGPDTEKEIITRLDNGAAVSIYEWSGDWARIKVAEDRYGWVNKDFITLRSATASRSADSEIRTPVAAETVEKTDAVETEGATLREKIVAYAKTLKGIKYRYGGTTTKGFDCSGFVQYVFKKNGITLERTSSDQGSNGTKIKKSELLPGDLVFFDTNGGHNAIEHVGIYIGDGNFIHASSGNSMKVTISSLSEKFYANSYMSARRYID
ncbi:MAG: SH3 domain-containing protein [Clostridiales bacterium]|nr:SH3 domain-containing protein [Clostridiales bacterium]